MKNYLNSINEIKLYTFQAGWREWMFLKISTNKEFGWCECTDTFKNLNGFSGILKDFSNLIINEDAKNIDRILWKLKTKSKSNPGSLVQRVIGAVENCLFDLFGKLVNKPVHEILGNKIHSELELYWSHCGTTRVRTPQFLKSPAIKSLKDTKSLCDEVNQTDFKVIKTNLATFNNGPKIYMPGHIVEFNNPDLSLSDEMLSEIDAWIGELNNNLNDDIYIAVDLNFNFNTKDLIKISNKLKKYRIKWLEIDSHEVDTLLNLKKETSHLIITGETIMGINALKEFIDSDCADIISIDVVWNGLSESKKISDYCFKKQKKVSTHNYNGYLGTFISAHFAATIENFFIAEIDIDEVGNLNDVFSHSPEINGRYLKIPNRPGWGCELNEKKLKLIYNA